MVHEILWSRCQCIPSSRLTPFYRGVSLLTNSVLSSPEKNGSYEQKQTWRAGDVSPLCHSLYPHPPVPPLYHSL